MLNYLTCCRLTVSEGKGREGKGREGKGREGKGREGKGREVFDKLIVLLDFSGYVCELILLLYKNVVLCYCSQ